MPDRYLLPDVWIDFDGTRRAFLRRLERVLRSSPRRVKSVEWRRGELSTVPHRQEGHAGLIFTVRCAKERSGVALIELRARRWRRHPTARGYASLAHRLFGPILRTFEDRWGSRLSLSVGRTPGLVRPLPPLTRTFFDRFLRFARIRWEKGEDMSRQDWQAFYAFVRSTHAGRVRLDDLDVETLLQDEGVPESTARELGTVYRHCRHFANAGFWNPLHGFGVWDSGTRNLPPPGIRTWPPEGGQS